MRRGLRAKGVSCLGREFRFDFDSLSRADRPMRAGATKSTLASRLGKMERGPR